ncbi:MAG: hypothetical protein LBM98_00105, partial [Oscillospiraceae bacterium]|nr:hypothetical protein [Oscillospiraceae bacterium]
MRRLCERRKACDTQGVTGAKQSSAGGITYVSADYGTGLLRRCTPYVSDAFRGSQRRRTAPGRGAAHGAGTGGGALRRDGGRRTAPGRGAAHCAGTD